MSDAARWFAVHAAEAPAELAARAGEFLREAPPRPTVADTLAGAGAAALRAAMDAGVGRHAALDLLAADALITAAVLEAAQAAPEQLGERARAIRRVAEQA